MTWLTLWPTILADPIVDPSPEDTIMTTTTDRPTVPEPSQPPKRRDRTHWLYIAVIVAVLAGVGVGIMAPDVGKSVGVLGTMFVALIKMMIAPVIEVVPGLVEIEVAVPRS